MHKKKGRALNTASFLNYGSAESVVPETCGGEGKSLSSGYIKFPALSGTASISQPLPMTSRLSFAYDDTLNYLPVFLSHAQLYVFADKYGVPDLQILVIARLYETMSRFNYHTATRTNIVELVTYAYDNTPDRHDELDRLRAVMVHFCANNIGALQESGHFRTLLEGGGSFVTSLVSKMCELFGGIKG